jgi:hypothetical protein
MTEPNQGHNNIERIEHGREEKERDRNNKEQKKFKTFV